MNTEDVLTSFHVAFITEGSHHCSEGWLQVDCPFCSAPGAGKWHMGIAQSGKVANCWKCGPHSLFRVLQAYGADERALGRAIKGLKQPLTSYKGLGRPSGTLTTPKRLQEGLQPPHSRYLARRGFDAAEVARIWDLGSTGQRSDLPWRIYIPIQYRGEVVSWTTRAISENASLRWVTAKPDQERYPSKKLIYGSQFCTTSVVIGEGPTDVWRLGPGAVCTLGMVVSHEQVLLLSKYPRRYVCFDNHSDAQKRAQALCSMLELFDGETFNVELDSEDLGSATPKEIRQLRRLVR